MGRRRGGGESGGGKGGSMRGRRMRLIDLIDFIAQEMCIDHINNCFELYIVHDKKKYNLG